MAKTTNKLLRVVLLLAGLAAASSAIVLLVPPCPIPASDDDGSTTTDPGSSDPAAEEFCAPDLLGYSPRDAVLVVANAVLGWFALNIYDYFATDDDTDNEVYRAAVARKLLVAAVLLVADVLVSWAAAVLVVAPWTIPPFDVKLGVLNLDWRVEPGSVFPYLLGGLLGLANSMIYDRFTFTDDDEEASRAANTKKYGYVTVLNDDPEDGGKN